jgi:hypothetical protein
VCNVLYLNGVFNFFIVSGIRMTKKSIYSGSGSNFIIVSLIGDWDMMLTIHLLALGQLWILG